MFAAGKTSGGGAAAATVDAQFNYVTMLLHGDGTNGAQNNTFLDSSSNNLTITRNGNSTQGSFSPYGSNWSNYFDGTGDRLSIASASALNIGSADMTMEFWMLIPIAFPSDYRVLFAKGTNTSGGNSYAIEGMSSGVLTLWVNTDGSSGWNLINGATIGTPTVGAWNHVVVCRSGTAWYSFMNGTRVLNTTGAGTVTASSTAVTIGDFGTAGFEYTGYISNLRLVNGTAIYANATTCTVPTAPLTAVTNTSLLTCQSNRFIDNSTNAFSITTTGTPSVQRFNPFGTATAYSTATIGGSGYFDGTGDALSIASNSVLTLSGDYTVEGWVYVVTEPTSAYRRIFQNAPGTTPTGYWYFYIGVGGTIAMYNNDVGTLPTVGNYIPRSWTHFAISRSGSTTRVFVNGVQTYSYSGSTTFTNNGWYISGGPDDEYANCYISNHRVVVGTAVYTGAFTPPTLAPLATSGAASAACYPSTTNVNTSFASGNTELLTSMINGAIFDNAMINDLETVGNAQISTSVVKYGTGSLYFDGTGDYLSTPSAPSNQMGSAPFTIEAWIYPTTISGTHSIVGKYVGGSIPNSEYWVFITSTGRLAFAIDGSAGEYYIETNTGAIVVNTWTYVTAIRTATAMAIYINGVQATVIGFGANNLSVNTTPLNIGAYNSGLGTYFGYIDELRITKGVARYSGASFTPPTAAFFNTGPY